MTLAALARGIAGASPYRRAAIACGAGALSTLALAPFNVWPILFITFPVLVWLIDGSSREQTTQQPSSFIPRARPCLIAARIGWWFGFGYFLTGLYWIGIAFLVDAKTFGWLMPFAVVSLPAALALSTALGCALARLLWAPGSSRILALAVCLTLIEWLRGHVLTGFPWNAYGYALTGSLELAQGSALIGLWGLTGLSVYIFASPAVLADDRKQNPHRWLVPASSVCILAMLAIYGTVRLSQSPTSFVPDARLRIMQPNLPQDDKFNYAAKASVMNRYLALSNGTSRDGTRLADVTHLIWPESAFPFFLARDADALAQIAGLLPSQTVLITGAARVASSAPNPGVLRAYNSVYVIDHTGALLATYDKLHLVPFGEYLPFQDWLESLGFMQLTEMRGGFVPGEHRQTIATAHAPAFLQLICYEIIFPDEAIPKGERPGWLLNLTNDGWFGNSTGPYQHFQQARVRAIEQGLPLVRAANTGISAVVDPLGRIVTMLPLGAEGILDADLPQPIPPTLYARLGDAPVQIIFGGIFLLLIGRRFSRTPSLPSSL